MTCTQQSHEQTKRSVTAFAALTNLRTWELIPGQALLIGECICGSTLARTMRRAVER